jgi:hypothetical protein
MLALGRTARVGSVTLPVRISEGGRKVKEILRSLKARTAEALLDAIGEALRAVTTTDAEGWFAHSGYGNTESLLALAWMPTEGKLANNKAHLPGERGEP